MKKRITQRGFQLYEFKDRNGVECSIQESSLATEPAIWLGADKLGIKEFIAYRQPSAWEDKPEFDEHSYTHHYVGNNRMHLTRKEVKKLLPILQNFVDTCLVRKP